mgnify:CR=1 FL=1
MCLVCFHRWSIVCLSFKFHTANYFCPVILKALFLCLHCFSWDDKGHSQYSIRAYFFFSFEHFTYFVFALCILEKRLLSHICLANIFFSSVVVFSFSWHCFTESLWGFLIFIFIYLTVPCLSCNMLDLVP